MLMMTKNMQSKSDIYEILQGDHNELTPIEDLKNWVEHYLRRAIHDDLYVVAHRFRKENNWDDVEVDLMIEEIEDNLVKRNTKCN